MRFKISDTIDLMRLNSCHIHALQPATLEEEKAYYIVIHKNDRNSAILNYYAATYVKAYVVWEGYNLTKNC